MWVDKQSWAQDILGADPQDLQKSLNRCEDLHCAPLVDVVNALVLLLPPFHPSTCRNTQSWAKAAVYCHKSFWAVYLFSAPPPPRVLSIVCKSSNQHAQILFNFTASRVALISSSHLGCLLFKSNGGFFWRGGCEGGVLQSCLACKQFESLQCHTTAKNNWICHWKEAWQHV